MARYKHNKTVSSPGLVYVALKHPGNVRFDLKSGSVELTGSNVALAGKEKGHLDTASFGITALTESQWEELKAAYGTLPHFKAGLIFAHEKKDSVQAEGEEKAELPTEFEPVDPEKDVRTEPAET